MPMTLDNAIWLAGILTEAAVVALLLYRRIWRTLPIFCTYCVWDIVSNVGTYVVARYFPGSYFHTYFVDTILDSALQFCVLVELAWSVLRPLRTSLPKSALIVVSILVLLTGAAIWPFAAVPGLTHVSRAAHLMEQLQQTVSILRVVFFLLLAGGSQLLSIGWRDRELQVATGMGLYSLVSLSAAMLHMHQTTASQFQHVQEFVVASYLCSLLYWAFSFAQKEAARREFTPQMQRVLLAMAGAARTSRGDLTEARINKPRNLDRR